MKTFWKRVKLLKYQWLLGVKEKEAVKKRST